MNCLVAELCYTNNELMLNFISWLLALPSTTSTAATSVGGGGGGAMPRLAMRGNAFGLAGP